jgi:transposase
MGLNLSASDEQTLRSWTRKGTLEARRKERAEIVLALGTGLSAKAAAISLDVHRTVVYRWRDRYLEAGIDGLKSDKPRPGRPPTIPSDRVKAIVTLACKTTPENATHWSTRSMAEAAGVSQSTVQRVWSGNGIKPHLVRTFKLSNDPRFEEKLVDVVGLYLDPPEKAMVLCVDEKSQIQALDRTQPGLPMKKGRCGTVTHDYKRHGTTTLFAALNTVTGSVIGSCKKQHRNEEFLEFLKQIDRRTPKDLDLHLVLDNYGTHKHKNVKDWLAENPRFHLHFVPTGCSWLNLVERFFAQITNKRIRRGAFESVRELEAEIVDYLKIHNRDPKPFKWTATAAAILDKVNRCREIKDSQH